VAWSTVNVAGAPLPSLLPLDKIDYTTFAEATKRKAYEIIKAKGFTSYGIGAATSSICEAIIFDHRETFPLSHWQDDLQCCLSLPAILGRSGIVSTISLPLEEQERNLIEESAKCIKDIISQYESSAN
jgi:L-lactate dehydrogenase